MTPPRHHPDVITLTSSPGGLRDDGLADDGGDHVDVDVRVALVVRLIRGSW